MNKMTQDLTLELVFYAGNALLEGPLWDDENQMLYFVSIDDDIIYRFNEETTEIDSYPTDGPVGAAVLDSDGNILSAEQRDRKSTRLNSSHVAISYAVFCL